MEKCGPYCKTPTMEVWWRRVGGERGGRVGGRVVVIKRKKKQKESTKNEK